MTPTVPDTTFSEMADSLTGFDEIAIEQRMGLDVYRDAEAKPVLLMRALVFVHQRRQGLPDAEAREAALGMTAGQVQVYFADDPDEAMPDDPATPAGKDSAPLA